MHMKDVYSGRPLQNISVIMYVAISGRVQHFKLALRDRQEARSAIHEGGQRWAPEP